jgi:2-dehydro-3-deoxygluconokinase
MPGGLVTLGEALVTIGSMDPGPWAVGSSLRASFAGAEANVAIGLARLGHPSCWIGRLGQDPAGNLVLRGLRAEAVDVSRVRRDADAPTAVLLREQRTSDRAGIRYFRSGSAGSGLTADDIDAEVVAGAGLVHVTGITAGLGPGPLAAVRRLVDLAQDAGVLVSFDVNYRAALWSEVAATKVLAALARQADLVFGGPEELVLLSQSGATDAAEVAAELLTAGVREVVLKDGAQGATSFLAPRPELVEGSGGGSLSPDPVDGPGRSSPELVEGPGGSTFPEPVEGPGRSSPEPVEGPSGSTFPGLVEGSRGATPIPESWSMPAFPVTVVDPVGAGDAFVAGYLSGVLTGLDPLAKLDRGARAGAIAVSTRGDWEGLPVLVELDTLLAGQDVTR